MVGRALVPAGRVLMTYPASRKYMMAARTIQGAWRHRRTIKRGAKMIYRYAKRRRTSKGARRTMPNARTKCMNKQEPIPAGEGTNGIDNIKMGALQVRSLPWPVFGDGLRQRERNVMLFKGVKICRYFEYNAIKDQAAADIGPLEVHWAMVQFKDPSLLISDLSILNDTFRSGESDTTRSQNFPSYNSSSTWTMLMNCQPLNPEKFKIITHKKFIILPYDSGNCARSWGPNRMPHMKKIDKYYKFSKILNFRNTSDGVPDNNIVEMFWYNTPTNRYFPADPVALNHVSTRSAHTLYYGDKGIRS